MESAISAFRQAFERDVTVRTIGVEAEYPVAHPNGEPVSWNVMRSLWDELATVGWSQIRCPETGEPIGAQEPARRGTTGFPVRIMTDVGSHILELQMTPCRTIHAAERQLLELLAIVGARLAKLSACLLGIGIQPLSPPGSKQLTPISRYRIIAEDGNSADFPFGLSAAMQTHIDVTAEEAVDLMNSFNATAGLRIAILANSSICRGVQGDAQAIREKFYDEWFGHRRLQVGIPRRFVSLSDYVEYICTLKCLLICRDGKCFRLDPRISFREYLARTSGSSATDIDGNTVVVYPRADDIRTQACLTWFATRLHPSYGTLEDRVACQQPTDSQLSAAALTLGLVTNAVELKAIANRTELEVWRAIRKEAYLHGLHALPQTGFLTQVRELLMAAETGLRNRGFGEETFLAPLFERLDAKCGAADRARSFFSSGGIRELVEKSQILW
ncbi:MAG: glutamate-cysteine ligase family protein [Pirellulaceae bacterium]